MPPVLSKSKDGEALEVDLEGARGAEFHDALDKVRKIDGRRFDWDRKMWCVPMTADNAHRLMATIRPMIVKDDLDTWLREQKVKQESELTTPLPPDAKLMLPWATKRMPWQPEVINDEPFNGLLDYQRAAVDAIVNAVRIYLCDDMGLGKTVQAIAAVEEFRLRAPDGVGYEGPKLVICPNSVKGAWERELRRWLGPDVKVQIINGSSWKARHKQLEEAIAEDAWIITNWEQVRIKSERRKTRTGSTRTIKFVQDPLYELTEWEAVIADEVHRAKNRKAKQTMGLWRIQCKGLQIGLTGTPIQNEPAELWPLLKWNWPGIYNDNGTATKPKTAYWSFFNQYVDAWEDPYGRAVITGVKNPDALRFELKGKIIRRTVNQVRTTPGRRRIYLPLEMGKVQKAIYKEAESKMWVDIQAAAEGGDRDAKRMLTDTAYLIQNGATRVLRLRQILESPALMGGPDESVILDDLVERVMDTRPLPWIVFTAFKPTCELIEDRLSRLEVGVFNGDVGFEERTELENRFQRGELDVIVGTLDAMREGVTLTASHLEYFCSRAWVPDWNEQAEARAADRLGQQNKTMIFVPQVIGSVATSKVAPANALKEGIVRSVVVKDAIEEGDA